MQASTKFHNWHSNSAHFPSLFFFVCLLSRTWDIFICCILCEQYTIHLIMNKIIHTVNFIVTISVTMLIQHHIRLYSICLRLYCQMAWHFIEADFIQKEDTNDSLYALFFCGCHLSVERKSKMKIYINIVEIMPKSLFYTWNFNWILLYTWNFERHQQQTEQNKKIINNCTSICIKCGFVFTENKHQCKNESHMFFVVSLFQNVSTNTASISEEKKAKLKKGEQSRHMSAYKFQYILNSWMRVAKKAHIHVREYHIAIEK